MSDTTTTPADAPRRGAVFTFLGGASIGALGGLIGLGGAEFRLPLLISAFGFAALPAVILNKAMSLIVVASALPFRAMTVPMADVWSHWPIVVTLMSGSLFGAYMGASWATQLRSQTLYRVIAGLLLGIAAVLVFAHGSHGGSEPLATGLSQTALGVLAGFLIGIVASVLGVAGGELLIPTIVLLFGVDLKLAGSLSLAVSLPTMLVGFARYSRDNSFAVLGSNKRFVITMAAGSILGTYLGALLLGVVPSSVLLPALAAILVVSAGKVWLHSADK